MWCEWENNVELLVTDVFVLFYWWTACAVHVCGLLWLNARLEGKFRCVRSHLWMFDSLLLGIRNLFRIQPAPRVVVRTLARPLKLQSWTKRYPEEQLNDILAPTRALSVSLAGACWDWLQPWLTVIGQRREWTTCPFKNGDFALRIYGEGTRKRNVVRQNLQPESQTLFMYTFFMASFISSSYYISSVLEINGMVQCLWTYWCVLDAVIECIFFFSSCLHNV